MNDDRAQIVISNVTADRRDEDGTTNFDFNAVLLDAVDTPVTVTYTTQDGTALLSDNDYTAATGPVTFAGAKDETKKITVLVTADSKVELNEFFVVRLSNIQASGRDVVFADDVGQGEIVDDDQAMLSIDDRSQAEGAGPHTFTVTLSNGVDGPVTVSYATADGTATTSDNDYVSTGNTLNFTGAAGETRTLNVAVNNDIFAEKDETFSVHLTNVQSGPYNVILGKSQGVGTIVNDDLMNLEITKDDRGVTAAPNDKILYDLAYRNLGSATARQVRLIEVVPANTTFDFASSPGFSCSPNPNAGSTCTRSVGTLSSGASGSAVFAVTVDDTLPGGVTQTSNTVSITDESDGGADSNLANNTDTVITTLKAAGTDFYTLPPCRVIDTRNPPVPSGLGGPAMVGSSERIFQVSASACGIPATASAIAVNVTVTQSTAPGNLLIYPSGSPVPTASTINYTVGLTRANNAVVSLNGGQIAVIAKQTSSSTAHFILDVTGYFK